MKSRKWMHFIAVLLAVLLALSERSFSLAAENADAVNRESIGLLNEAKALFAVDEVNAKPGDSVEIPVRITSNPGIAGALFELTYDKDALSLTEIARGTLLAGGTWNADKEKGTIQWYDTCGNMTETGVLFILKFVISESASAGKHAVSFNMREENLTNYDFTNVPFGKTAGGVTIEGKEPESVPVVCAAFMLGEATAVPGGQVELPVQITENPGIAGAFFEIQYDADALTLTGIDKGPLLSTGTFNADTAKGTVQWYTVDGDMKSKGLLFTLRFAVKENAKTGASAVTLLITDANLTNHEFQNVPFTVSSGQVKITGEKSENYTVTFISEGEIVVTQNVEKGKCADAPKGISREGYILKGWYLDEGFKREYDFNTPIYENTTLYAKWEKTGSEPVSPDGMIALVAENTEYDLIPGEVRRLSVSNIDQYIYGVKWILNDASPSNCITLKNGVVTAKKAGYAKVTAIYGTSRVTFTIHINDCSYENTQIQLESKKIKITATKSITETIGAAKKKITVTVPEPLRTGITPIDYKVINDGVCAVGTPAFNANGSKATFEITPLESGATWIVWSMSLAQRDGSVLTTQAVSKVIVKKPISNLSFAESSVSLTVGQGKRLTVIGTKNNTDAKDLVFSVSGQGVKVSKSGFVVATKPNSNATVRVKSGKAIATIPIHVGADYSTTNYLTLNKHSVIITAPQSGMNPRSATVNLATPRKVNDRPGISWFVIGSPKGISVNRGRIRVDSSANPGSYVIGAYPNSGIGNAAYCELIVK